MTDGNAPRCTLPSCDEPAVVDYDDTRDPESGQSTQLFGSISNAPEVTPMYRPPALASISSLAASSLKA
ncbi:hypothetical protein [Halococcus salsus]|uniref:hypothetical protein n=1 Tax=Halococcus salsus TaxID=2162894 RepID=UPI0013593E7F|nr:hypothetical protein [Halococcus salsus]